MALTQSDRNSHAQFLRDVRSAADMTAVGSLYDDARALPLSLSRQALMRVCELERVRREHTVSSVADFAAKLQERMAWTWAIDANLAAWSGDIDDTVVADLDSVMATLPPDLVNNATGTLEPQ